MQKKLSAFPGVIFNYTQPAEDAVDEAETGLKSALAVKIFGSDLQSAGREGRPGEGYSAQDAGASPKSPWCRRLGQPSLIDHARPRQDWRATG